MKTETLDEIIVRLAAKTAHQLMVAGRPADVAVASACPGAWAALRGQVRAQLAQNVAPPSL